jgi:hypothetical protein
MNARKLSGVEKLRRRGFDLSYAVPFERAWKVRCSQCEALVINGVPCHESGCSSEPQRGSDEGEEYEP